MLVAYLFFTVINALIKDVTIRTNVFQVTFLRSIFGCFLLTPFIIKNGFCSIKSKSPKLLFLRSSLGGIAMLLFFYALPKLPLAMSTAVSFATPLLLIPYSFLLLKEKAGLKRTFLTILGFVGVLIIIHPTKAGFSSGVIAVLLSISFGALFFLLIKKLYKDSAFTLLFWYGAATAIISFIPAIINWEHISSYDVFLILCGAFCATSGHYILTLAYKIAEPTLIAPFMYVQIVYASILGFIVFDERLTVRVIIGSLVIILSNILISRTKKHLKQKKGG